MSNSIPSKNPRRDFTRRGFTLVELLVVIGIIALLISILLPVLGRVQRQARDVQCQSQLRSIAQGLMNYASDNDGSLPWGKYEDQAGFKSGSYTEMFWWCTLIGQYFDKDASSTTVTFQGEDGIYESQVFDSEIWRCPEAKQVIRQPLTYVAHPVAMPDLEWELANAANYPIQGPAKMHQTFPDTALVWETCVFPELEDSNTVGYINGWDVDVQRLAYPVAPIQRYYAEDVDKVIPNYPFRPEFPLLWDDEWENIDPNVTPGQNSFGYQGNLRFRHNGDKSGNVAFADGSVRSIAWPSDIEKKGNFQVSNGFELKRRNFLLKWPSGVPAVGQKAGNANIPPL